MRVFKLKLPKSNSRPDVQRDSCGVALFMVLSAIGVLSLLVTEFTYVANTNRAIAYGGLDQLKAHYLAKSALKLAFLRLRAYYQINAMTKSMGAGAQSIIPKGMLQKIWNFPFFFPIPSTIPGLSMMEKDAILAFQKESKLDGKFSMLIESESSKYNLNSILASALTPVNTTTTVPPPKDPPDPSKVPPGNENKTVTPANTPPAVFDPQEARNALTAFLGATLDQKNLSDPEFYEAHRDLRLDELVDSISAWADRTYERRYTSARDKIQMKRAPFYTVTELHMVPGFDDDLYNLFAPSLTASPTSGINVNQIKEGTLRALFPLMTKPEAAEFFKFRDQADADNSFKNAEAFYTAVSKLSSYYSVPQQMEKQKADLAKRNIVIVTDEDVFKITIQAEVNKTIRTIEAWVTLVNPAVIPDSSQNTAFTPPISGDGKDQIPPPMGSRKDSGIKVFYMKVS